MRNDTFILAEDAEISLNSHETWRNNNVLIVGSSASGKSRTVIEPNLYNNFGSYLISDPKGALYKKFGNLFRLKGYDVKVVDLVKPSESCGYNPFAFLRNETDVLAMSHILCGKDISMERDPFWDRAAQLLLSAIIYYILETVPKKKQTLPLLLSYLTSCYRVEGKGTSRMDTLMTAHKKTYPDSPAVRQYEKIMCSEKTYNCVVLTLQTKLGLLDGEGIRDVLSGNSIDFRKAGVKDTAIFLVCSDTDRSLDVVANLFFSQALHELTVFADTECENEELPTPVMFVLDDFATSVVIDDFQNSIATIRSRNVSAVLVVQAESQLQEKYGMHGGKTIISNCDTYLFLGTNDVSTAEAVSIRANKPVEIILSLPIDECIVFRRGEKPRFCKKYFQYARDMERIKENVKKRIAKIDGLEPFE